MGIHIFRITVVALISMFMTSACTKSGPADPDWQAPPGADFGGQAPTHYPHPPTKADKFARTVRDTLTFVDVTLRKPLFEPVQTAKRLLGLAKTAVTELLIPKPLPRAKEGPVPLAENGKVMDLAVLEAALDKHTSSHVYQGKLALLIDGPTFFGEFEVAVSEAKSSIKLRTYIYDNDDYALFMAERFKEKSRAIEVKILSDGLGSLSAGYAGASSRPADHQPPPSISSFLRANSNIRFRRQANAFLSGDHIKTFIIDNRTVYLGGMNIGREYRHDWHDMMVRVTGPAVVPMIDGFDRNWARAGPFGELGWLFRKRHKYDIVALPDDYPIRLIYTRTGRPDIFRAQREAMRLARKRIYVQNAYMSDDGFAKELIRARKRGVDVRVVFSFGNDNPILSRSNMITANILMSHGVRIFYLRGMSHIKAFLADDWVTMGTANYDLLSLHINDELNVATSHPPIVQALLGSLFEKDFEAAEEITEPFPVTFKHRLAEFLADFL